MAFEDEIDEAEHQYWADFCPGCGASPCQLADGETDEFHADLPDPLDALADKVVYGVLLAAFAEYGITLLAFNRAERAVRDTTAIAREPVNGYAARTAAIREN